MIPTFEAFVATRHTDNALVVDTMNPEIWATAQKSELAIIALLQSHHHDWQQSEPLGSAPLILSKMARRRHLLPSNQSWRLRMPRHGPGSR